MPVNLYTTDIKLLVVRMVLRGMRFHEIVRTLGVDVSLTSVRRWFHLYQTTHAVVTNPLNHMARGGPTTLGPAEREFVLECLRLDPTLYLDELQAKILETHGVQVSVQALSKELRDRLHWTLKKARTVHPNQSAAARGAYIEAIQDIDPRCLVFTDETALTKRRLCREFARAPVGERTTRLQRPTQAFRWSVLPAISMDGILAICIQQGGYVWLDFEDYLENHLLPAMNPWPQRNSVLVMDNAPIHHGGRVADLCAARGVRLIYLPPYSPDFNPIEKGFSPLKARLRRTQEIQNCVDADEERARIFVACMDLFTQELCESLFRGASYI